MGVILVQVYHCHANCKRVRFEPHGEVCFTEIEVSWKRIEFWLQVDLFKFDGTSNDNGKDQDEANAAAKTGLEELLALVRELHRHTEEIKASNQLLRLLHFVCHLFDEYF